MVSALPVMSRFLPADFRVILLQPSALPGPLARNAPISKL